MRIKELARSIDEVNVSTVESFLDEAAGERRLAPLTWWAMSMCFACQKGSVWRGIRVVYPITNAFDGPHADMPAVAAMIYEEARAVGVVSRRAGAALARAALEQLLKDLLQEETGRLDDRITALSGRVSMPLWQMLTVLRHAGNKSLHGADDSDVLVAFVLDDDSGEMFGLLFSAVNDLVEELVTRPKQVAAPFGQLPAGVASAALLKAGLSEPVVAGVPAETPEPDDSDEPGQEPTMRV